MFSAAINYLKSNTLVLAVVGFVSYIFANNIFHKFQLRKKDKEREQQIESINERNMESQEIEQKRAEEVANAKNSDSNDYING